MLVEAMGLEAAVGDANWLWSFIHTLLYTKGVPRDHQKTAPVVLKSQNPLLTDPDGVMIMDAKSLFDCLATEQTLQEDRRASLVVGNIRDVAEPIGMVPRWVPHNYNPADVFTKISGVHRAPMLNLLKTGHLCIMDMKEALKQRAKEKAEFGAAKRIKQRFIEDPEDLDADDFGSMD